MSTMRQGDIPEPRFPSLADDEAIPFGARAVRAALQAQLRQYPECGAPELRRLAVLLSGEARRREMRIEQLVVMLKRTWLSLPESAQPNRAIHASSVERLITLCIEEFFRGAPGARRGGD